MSKKKYAHKKRYPKKPITSDWDTLASSIIELETKIHKITAKKQSKQLVLLKKQLQILEKEKESRVADTFDAGRFLNKDIPILLEEEDLSF
jgi:hypothetical protein